MIEIRFTEEELELIINCGVLTPERAQRIMTTLNNERRIAARQKEEQRKEDERRAERAKNFTLTEKQAGMMAAIRIGKGAFSDPVKTYDGRWKWQYSRSMGGARARMWQRLEDEGLVARGGRSLTPAGLERLQEYEKRKGEFPK